MKVAELVHTALAVPDPKVRYAIVPNPGQMLLQTLLPKRVVDRIIEKRLALTASKR